MKRAFSFLFPIIAVLGCGKVSSRIISALLSLTFGIMLASGVALSLAPLLEASGSSFLLLTGVSWLAAWAHAMSVVKRHFSEKLSKEEDAQLMQQTELMRLAAAKRNSVRQQLPTAEANPKASSATQARSDP